ncbi:hypothetical protein N825_26975 [Skermanella stibiiresistens SB22]|uniref:Uncharacterized protein n=1 Tax=Skermanella stibiiresistens SB22 TaxID=1385369 RepID=W9GVC5_9PROT|nr:hypothetical protein [Skermanella stibiiresistens]EWY36392.1 hypothetical protein N825_26975 [Skermanella stibiiresistens SB22]
MTLLTALDIHLERLVGELHTATPGERRHLEDAIGRVTRARELILQAERRREAARRRLAMDEAAARRQIAPLGRDPGITSPES